MFLIHHLNKYHLGIHLGMNYYIKCNQKCTKCTNYLINQNTKYIANSIFHIQTYFCYNKQVRVPLGIFRHINFHFLTKNSLRCTLGINQVLKRYIFYKIYDNFHTYQYFCLQNKIPEDIIKYMYYYISKNQGNIRYKNPFIKHIIYIYLHIFSKNQLTNPYIRLFSTHFRIKRKVQRALSNLFCTIGINQRYIKCMKNDIFGKLNLLNLHKILLGSQFCTKWTLGLIKIHHCINCINYWKARNTFCMHYHTLNMFSC